MGEGNFTRSSLSATADDGNGTGGVVRTAEGTFGNNIISGEIGERVDFG